MRGPRSSQIYPYIMYGPARRLLYSDTASHGAVAAEEAARIAADDALQADIDLRVLKAGDTMSGPLNINYTGPALALSLAGNFDQTLSSDTSWGPLGQPAMIVSAEGGQNSIIGYNHNALAPGGPGWGVYPAGVSGYGKLETTSSGNTAFGMFGLAEMYATGGGTAVAAEFTARNYNGAADTALPPNVSFGTTTNVANGLHVTAGGNFDCSVGVYINVEGGSVHPFSTGQYIQAFRLNGLVIAAQASGSQTNIRSSSNGAGTNLILETTTAMTAANRVVSVIDNGAVERFAVRQDGTLVAGALTPTSPQAGSAVATHLASSGPNIGINATFSGSGWNYLAGTGRCAYGISGDSTSGNLAFFAAPAGNAGAAATMTATVAIQSSGNVLIGGNLLVGTAAGTTNPVLTSSAPNWYTSLYAPDAVSLGTGIHIGSVGSGGTTYHRQGTHAFQNSAGSTTYASFQALGTYNISGSWLIISDAATKANVTPYYERGLAAVMALQPVSFTYNEKSPFGQDGKTRYGLIADQVRPVVPEAVGTYTHKTEKDGEVELSTLDPGHLTYVLINAIKEMKAEIDALKARLG